MARQPGAGIFDPCPALHAAFEQVAGLGNDSEERSESEQCDAEPHRGYPRTAKDACRDNPAIQPFDRLVGANGGASLRLPNLRPAK